MSRKTPVHIGDQRGREGALAIAAAALVCLLAGIAAAMVGFTASVDAPMPTPDPVLVVYDRPSHDIYHIETTCPTCGGKAISDMIDVLCFNPECPVYGIAVEAGVER